MGNKVGPRRLVGKFPLFFIEPFPKLASQILPGLIGTIISNTGDTSDKNKNDLDPFLKFNKLSSGVFDAAEAAIRAITELTEEAQKNMDKMNAQLKSLKSADEKFKAEYYTKFMQAKTEIRYVRNQLKKLASKTMAEVRSLKLLLSDVNRNGDAVLLKISLKKLKDLMTESREILDDSTTKYYKSIRVLDELNSKFQTLKTEVEYTLMHNTAEYDKTSSSIRKKGYGYSALCLIFPPSCVIVYASVAGVVESDLSRYRGELEFFKTISKDMMESSDKINKKVKEAINMFNTEIQMIDAWVNSVNIVSKNIDEFPVEYLCKYASIRTIFMSGLIDLENSASNFYNCHTSKDSQDCWQKRQKEQETLKERHEDLLQHSMKEKYCHSITKKFVSTEHMTKLSCSALGDPVSEFIWRRWSKR